MPKQKTKKAMAKRFKKTGTGKFKRSSAGGAHILTGKSRKQKRSRAASAWACRRINSR